MSDDARKALAQQLWAPVADTLRLGHGHARYELQYQLVQSVRQSTGEKEDVQLARLRKDVDYMIRPPFRQAVYDELVRLRTSVLTQFPYETTEGAE